MMEVILIVLSLTHVNLKNEIYLGMHGTMQNTYNKIIKFETINC